MSNSLGSGSFRYGAEACFFAKSAENFKATLSTKDAEEFENSRRDLVLRDLIGLQNQLLEKRSLMNMKRVQRFLDGMNDLQTVLEKLAFPAVDSVMACIWGPMRFFFKVVNVQYWAFDRILDVYHRLGLSTLPFRDYVNVFLASQNSIKCLLHTYEDVLKFHAAAYSLFSLRSELRTKLHRATWKDLEPTFYHISSTLRLHKTCIEDHGSFLRRMGSGLDDPSGNDANRDLYNEFRAYELAYDESQKRFIEEEREQGFLLALQGL
ncbi:hypothetical protein EsH8_XV_000041 [Colletotrichum jinshuiense]